MIKPWLLLPAEWSHALHDPLFSFYSQCSRNRKAPEWKPLYWRGLYFPNPLAPAGGVDKSAKHIKAWWALGAGFIELGTITPLPQKKNEGPFLKRNIQKQALWNHLGFPNEGVNAVTQRLEALTSFKPTPIFANIGKNRNTKNERAQEDCIQCISKLSPFVDAFVINISSPNTEKLTELFRPELLRPFLKDIQQKLSDLEKPLPFFLKWSPDLTEKDFLLALDIALECGSSGQILCNSTKQNKDCGFPEYGGVSGAPLASSAEEKLLSTIKHLGPEKKNQLLVSVGGVLSPKDVFKRLDMGADLVQTYSALVFQGPFFLRRVQKEAHGRKDRNFQEKK